MRFALLLAALWLAACVNSETGDVPVEGSTYRMSPVTQMEDAELDVQIFRTREECRQAVGPPPAEDLCVPQVDRKNGEVRMSFRLRRKRTGDVQPLSLNQDLIRVFHMGSPVGAAASQKVTLTPMEEQRSGQLFIVLIDGSGSMYENDSEALTKVYNALRNREVIDAFYPGDVDTGVVLLRFTKTVRGLDGGPPVVLNTRTEYKQMLEYIASSDRGFTHLYDAVSYAVGDLMEEQSLKDWKTIRSAEPTIIALTDGFNNQEDRDSCATNAPRLQKVLEDISRARQETSFQDRPTVYTVGLGKAIRPRFQVPDAREVRPLALCGRFANSKINGVLEREGIDNASLAWMAKAGGGETFVSNNDRGLAEVFKAAAAVRYGWYQLRYRVDGFYHRRSFESKVTLLAFARASGEVTFHPSGWIDGPSRESESGEWREPEPFWASLGPVMIVLGLLVLVHFMGPAGYNARRAVFRKARPTGAETSGTTTEPPATAGVPQGPTPGGEPPAQG